MPEATDRYTATRLSAELGLDNWKMRDILSRVNPIKLKGRSKLYLLRDVIPHAAKYVSLYQSRNRNMLQDQSKLMEPQEIECHK